MPKSLPKSTPKLRHHKASGQGFVELNGHRHYLGVYGRPETEQQYHRLIAEWIANGRTLPVDPEQITVVEIIHRFWQWAKTYFRKPDGATSRELENYRSALRPLRRLYGNVPAVDFGPRVSPADQRGDGCPVPPKKTGFNRQAPNDLRPWYDRWCRDIRDWSE